MSSFPTYQPGNTLIAPIVHELARRLQAEVPGIAQVYEDPIDQPPPSGSLVLPLTKFKVEGDTNGKLFVRLTFGIRLVWTRTELAADVANAYTYVLPILQCLGSWEAQTLTDTSGQDWAISVTPGDGFVAQWQESSQNYIALVVNTEVLTEFSVATAS